MVTAGPGAVKAAVSGYGLYLLQVSSKESQSPSISSTCVHLGVLRARGEP
jgi:hypothetical protein